MSQNRKAEISRHFLVLLPSISRSLLWKEEETKPNFPAKRSRLVQSGQRRRQCLGDGFLHERLDLRRLGRTEFPQCEGSGPHGAIVEHGYIVEAERGVAGLELVGALEEADDLFVAV